MYEDEENAAEKEAREERDYNVSAYEIFPIRQWNRWRDDLETHVFVQDAKPGAEAKDVGHVWCGRRRRGSRRRDEDLADGLRLRQVLQKHELVHPTLRPV